MTTSAWDELSAVIAAAPYPVSVLAADSNRVMACMSGLAVSTRSWLGALVANAGGLLVDHGWLRVLGSGTDALPDILADAEPGSGVLPVAYDVLGGEFVWKPNDNGDPTIHYFAPDDLAWQDLDLGYADWLHAMLTGTLDRFYETLRWPGWQQEVAGIPLSHGIHLYPPPWSTEGKDLATVSRRVAPLAELIVYNHDMARQLDGPEPLPPSRSGV